MTGFKIGDRVAVSTSRPNQEKGKVVDVSIQHNCADVLRGEVVDISTLHSFLKVKSDATGLEQWHQAEWCSLL